MVLLDLVPFIIPIFRNNPPKLRRISIQLCVHSNEQSTIFIFTAESF